MLMIDAFLTLATWLPWNLYMVIADSLGSTFSSIYTEREIFSIGVVLTGVMLTNVFTTPIVYYIFNRNFRVRL